MKKMHSYFVLFNIIWLFVMLERSNEYDLFLKHTKALAWGLFRLELIN